jgi:hypothetical protein
MPQNESTQEKEREHRHEEKEKEKDRQRKGEGRGAQGFIVDLGRHARRDVDRLRKGRGPLMDDVEDAIQELRDTEAISASVQTVIVVVSEKRAMDSMVLPVLLPPGIPAALPMDFGTCGKNDDDEDEDDED